MEQEYVSLKRLKQVIYTMSERLYYMDYDGYGNIIEIEFGCDEHDVDQIMQSVFQKDHLGVWVTRFYTSYLNKISTLDEPYYYRIPPKDYQKISRNSKFF
jgi:hypothetical protein